MSTEPLHPDDIAHIIPLRRDLDDAFSAAVRWYRLNGADPAESRERAALRVIAALKQVTLDLTPSPETVTLRVVWDLISRLTLPTLWGVMAALIALLVGIFSLGVYLGPALRQ